MITRDPLADRIPHGYVGEAHVNNRKVIVTPSRVCIGLLHETPKPVQSKSEAFAEDIIMHRGTFWPIQRMVLELCAATRSKA